MATAPQWHGRARFSRVGGRRSDKWGLELDPKFNDQVSELISRAYPRLGNLVAREMERLLVRVRKRWPVSNQDKPHSRDTIDLRYKVNGDEYTVTLFVGADYAADIVSDGERVAETLILDEAEPMAKLLEKLAAQELIK